MKRTNDKRVICQALILIIVLTPGITVAGTHFIHTDHLGTPRVLTDENQAVVWAADYMPFGEALITTATVTNKLRFPGQYFDNETGLHYNYFRDYDPSLGRYMQSDPIGLQGGLNTYGYVYQNPLAYTDATGQGAIGAGICATFEFANATSTILELNKLAKELSAINQEIEFCLADIDSDGNLERIRALEKLANEIDRQRVGALGKGALIGFAGGVACLGLIVFPGF